MGVSKGYDLGPARRGPVTNNPFRMDFRHGGGAFVVRFINICCEVHSQQVVDADNKSDLRRAAPPGISRGHELGPANRREPSS